MKSLLVFTTTLITSVLAFQLCAQPVKFDKALPKKSISSKNDQSPMNLYLDVHYLGAGKVTAQDVAAAHLKDLAVESKYGVNLIKYWVDEKSGTVMCLAQAPDSMALIKTHKEAHGLIPDEVYEVTEGQQAALKGKNHLYLDLHELGAGNVTAEAVADAHRKDLAVQKKYGVNFINYWVDEKRGVVVCLSEAPDPSAVINTHKEAHGLVPVKVELVQQGQ
ncbi:MAG TPA: DUF4242 domain-containing protein [Chitinophagaceae bacterium]|jgi:hypothetical protein|nr:DUF4242 domain-containing protein [Chitinophagaceae bacterium]